MAIQACPKCGAKNRVDENAATVSQPVCGKCGEKLPDGAAAAPGTSNGKPQVVTDATFASDVVGASASLPVLDQLAAESQGRYKIAKLNVDENPRTSAQFQIRSIPTMLIFKNGQVVDQIVGAVPKQTIASRLAAQL